MSTPTIEQLAMSEAEMLSILRQAAGTCNWRCYHTARSDRSEPGWPDLVLCRPPELLFVELKTMRGRLSEPQALWLNDLQASGVEVLLVRPSTLDALLERLAKRRRS